MTPRSLHRPVEPHADLPTGEGVNLTPARPLSENSGRHFEGTKKCGDFDVPGDIARSWLGAANANAKPNSLVVKPWVTGQDITRRPSDTWIIDFGTDMPENEASRFELPYQHVVEKVKPYRQTVNRQHARRNWWLHEESRVAMRRTIGNLERFIVTPRVSKHRFFVWVKATLLPDTRLCVIACHDDTTFGILSSRLHEVWARARASMHGEGNDSTYNAKSCFETFPFPEGMTPRDTAPKRGQATPPCMAGDILAENIAAAARHLNELRENWLNPPEWVDWTTTPEEEKAGFPKRPVAKPGHEADLRKRTLANLYKARPDWLDLAHKHLDQAVAAAYGWPGYTPEAPDEKILRGLLALNLERAAR